MLQLETANELQANRIVSLERKVEALHDHIDNLENRGRRKNVRILILPEYMEGRNALDFFEHWLPDFLNMDAKGGRVKLERAHRSLMPKPGSDQRPHPVNIRFHTLPDKQSDGSSTAESSGRGYYSGG